MYSVNHLRDIMLALAVIEIQITVMCTVQLQVLMNIIREGRLFIMAFQERHRTVECACNNGGSSCLFGIMADKGIRRIVFGPLDKRRPAGRCN